MKTIMKRIGVMVLAGVMLWSVSVGVSAETEKDPPKHECAFSYMYTQHLGTTHITYHTYVDEDGTHTCEVVVDQYRYVYKCACGATQYGKTYGIQSHTAPCGQR